MSTGRSVRRRLWGSAVQQDPMEGAAKGRENQQQKEMRVSDNHELTIETITPEIAAEMLQHNHENRVLRRGRVAAYTTDMSLGRWKLTGDPIVFDHDGRLLQGQHRLHACVRAEVPFVSAVMRNADPSIFVVLDSGLGRRNSDVLAAGGVKCAKDVAAIATKVWQYDQAVIAGRTWMQGAVNRADLMEFVSADQDAFEAAALVSNRLRKAISANGCATGSFYFLVTRKAAAAEPWARGVTLSRLESFVEGLAGGVNLAETDPRLHYRQWLYRPHKTNQSYANEAFMTMIKCWNAFFLDEPMRQLKTFKTGSPLLEVRVVEQP